MIYCNDKSVGSTQNTQTKIKPEEFLFYIGANENRTRDSHQARCRVTEVNFVKKKILCKIYKKYSKLFGHCKVLSIFHKIKQLSQKSIFTSGMVFVCAKHAWVGECVCEMVDNPCNANVMGVMVSSDQNHTRSAEMSFYYPSRFCPDATFF